MAEITIRKAELKDAEDIFGIIAGNAGDGSLMKIPIKSIQTNIGDYLVAENEGELVGCGAVHRRTENMYEVSSISVPVELQKGGIGRRLLTEILDKWVSNKFLFLGTDKPEFYVQFGFVKIQRREIPLRVWLKRSASLFDQDIRAWPKIMRTSYTFMKYASRRRHST